MSYARISEIAPGASIRSGFDVLEARIDRLEECLMFEEELRRQHPALQDLYDKYQATKRLIK